MTGRTTPLECERVGRRRAVRAARLAVRLAVDELFELLARLEVRDLLRRDVDLVARLRVAALPRLTLAQPEAAEAAQLDLLTPMQRIDDALEDRVDDDLGVLLRQVGDTGDLLHELRLGHAAARRCRKGHGGQFLLRKWSPSVADPSPALS